MAYPELIDVRGYCLRFKEWLRTIYAQSTELDPNDIAGASTDGYKRKHYLREQEHFNLQSLNARITVSIAVLD